MDFILKHFGSTLDPMDFILLDFFFQGVQGTYAHHKVVCFTLLPQLDSAEHLHVWPHLAEAMLVVEDILAVLDNPALMW